MSTGFSTCVSFQVSYKAFSITKMYPTLKARVCFLLRTGFLVFYEVWHLCKSLVTHIAFIACLACVNSKMPGEVRLTKESFPTFGTLVRELSWMNCQMPIKYLPGSKAFSTLSTSVWLLSRAVLLMGSGAQRFFPVGCLSCLFEKGVPIMGRHCDVSA